LAKHFAAAGACIAVLLAGLCVFLWYTSATSLQLLGPRSESPHPSGCALCTLSCVGLQPGCLCIMVRTMLRTMYVLQLYSSCWSLPFNSCRVVVSGLPLLWGSSTAEHSHTRVPLALLSCGPSHRSLCLSWAPRKTAVPVRSLSLLSTLEHPWSLAAAGLVETAFGD